MLIEKSAGIIFFRAEPKNHQRLYLIIRSSRIGFFGDDNFKNKKEFWDFPKGLLEGKEKGIDAATREAYEETGIHDFKITEGFKETVKYFTKRDGKTALKFVAMFLAEVKSSEVKLSWEHDKYEWLPFQEAYDKISRVEMKKALENAENFLKIQGF